MKTRSSYPAKAKQHDDPMKQLKQLSGEMNPGQVFKKFVERHTPDPVEMEIAPPAQLFSEIIEGKVKITFEVGLRLGRYFGSCVQGLVQYQHVYDDQMDPNMGGNRLGAVQSSQEGTGSSREGTGFGSKTS